MVNFKRLLYTPVSKYVISIILGFGLATLFRKVCNDRSCMIFKAPQLNKIKGQVFKFGKKCYKFNEEIENCNNNKKIVQFA